MRVLVTGGRDFQPYSTVMTTLDYVHCKVGITEIIHGGAGTRDWHTQIAQLGADLLAGRWAEERGIKETCMPADWETHGRAAGPIRNSAMIDLNPDLVVAFSGGKGTSDLLRKARARKIKIFFDGEIWK